MNYFLLILTGLLFPVLLSAQHQHHAEPLPGISIVNDVQPQPLLAQANRLKEALSFLGSSLSAEDAERLRSLQDKPFTAEISNTIQKILDPYCIAMVDINPESRVKVARGPAKAKLIQNGWTSFLVKIYNEAGVTAQLNVASKNADPLLHKSTFGARVEKENILTAGQVANRFLEMEIYRNRPLLPNLSGLRLEYGVLQVYSKDAGQREA